jgi:flavin reductase (DIM6/NTAB) family NADH-FMN oxidoreductase RutF
MAVKDLYFYDAVEGHGLPHDPFNGIIGPRPIGWISSRDQDGALNLAPYSFFNGLNYNPHILGFSSTSWKDTVAIIERTGEFVWNLATMDLAEAMNATAAGVPRNVDEFQLAGLTPVPSRFVSVPRVGEWSASSYKSFSFRMLRAKRRAPGWSLGKWLVFTSTSPCL